MLGCRVMLSTQLRNQTPLMECMRVTGEFCNDHYATVAFDVCLQAHAQAPKGNAIDVGTLRIAFQHLLSTFCSCIIACLLHDTLNMVS